VAAPGLCYTIARSQRFIISIKISIKGVIMPRGREKDRKTRKKHRKNVKRVKALVKARQKGKRTGKKS
jgi:hypothetical protein